MAPVDREPYIGNARRDLEAAISIDAPRIRREEKERIKGLLQRPEVGTAASLAAGAYRQRQAEAPPSPEADIGPYVLKAAWDTLDILDSGDPI
jgi:hypothetical protein